ncbi:MAG TPA: hypothetical protein VFA26_14940 [Gemmataceae bacterium]|nr:hypothetical protein [Gemmataceae bacterium]
MSPTPPDPVAAFLATLRQQLAPALGAVEADNRTDWVLGQTHERGERTRQLVDAAAPVARRQHALAVDAVGGLPAALAARWLERLDRLLQLHHKLLEHCVRQAEDRWPPSADLIQRHREAVGDAQRKWDALAAAAAGGAGPAAPPPAAAADPARPPSPPPAPAADPPGLEPGKGAVLVLLRMVTGGVVDERLREAARVLADDALTTNEKLARIDALIPIPPTASARQLAEMLSVSKQTIAKTDWWIRNRRGEKASEIARRRERHRRRAEGRETGDDE